MIFGTRARSVSGRKSFILPAALFVVAAGISALISDPAVGSNGLASIDPTAASLEYRSVLYGHMLDSLASHPLGWGPAGLPVGVYVIRSSAGLIDISSTVDSEPVLLAFEYGVIGLGAFVLVASLALDRAIRISDTSSDALAILVVCSTFLAIHPWTGLGAAAFILIGGAAAVRRNVALPKPQLAANCARERGDV
jgi:hypothetical protein